MLAPRFLLLLVYPYAVGGTECLVGCLVQGIDPFDDDNVAVWDDRGACDATNSGCETDARSYPSTTFRGALWASTSGTDGSSSCTCDICDPFPYGGTTDYMVDDTSLWNRIQCYIAASEEAGYDVSPCVAAVLDTGTMACVDEVYEAPTVPLYECEDNGMVQHLSWTIEVCDWAGTSREAKEMFPATSGSSSASEDTSTCLVGCLVQGIDPFEDVDQAVWDSRGACDSTTIGCEVSTIIYPTFSFLGALWALSSGTDGSSGCTCNVCDPLLRGGTADYMPDESLWSRIQCYLVASEASGYDVSPCVAAILETGTLPCVDEVYEAPTVGLLTCEENTISDLDASSPVDQCVWAGDVRSAGELFEGAAPTPLPLPNPTPTPLRKATPSPLPSPTLSPIPSPTQSPVPDPTQSPLLAPTEAPALAPTTVAPYSITPAPARKPDGTLQPRTASPEISDPIPVAPVATLKPSPTGTVSPEPVPVAPSVTSSPGSLPPIIVEGTSCDDGSTCSESLCCHPEDNTCGRKYTFCQQREFSNGPRCCSGMDGDTSASNVCLEDSICDKPEGRSGPEELDLWIGITSGIIAICGCLWGTMKCFRNISED